MVSDIFGNNDLSTLRNSLYFFHIMPKCCRYLYVYLIVNPIDGIIVWNKYCGLKKVCAKMRYAHLQQKYCNKWNNIGSTKYAASDHLPYIIIWLRPWPKKLKTAVKIKRVNFCWLIVLWVLTQQNSLYVKTNKNIKSLYWSTK